MTDEREILNLLSLYMELTDAAKHEEIADMFRHATIRGEAGGRILGTMQGYEEILASRAGERVFEDGTLRTKHLLTNTFLELETKVARARSYFTVLQATDNFPLQPIISGRYHDVLEKDEGIWRFRERVFILDLIGDLSQHLSAVPEIQ